MLKIKIISGLIAIVMTLLTIYLVPIIYLGYTHWSDSLTPQQQQWFNYSQIALGILLTVWALRQWKKRARKTTDEQ